MAAFKNCEIFSTYNFYVRYYKAAADGRQGRANLLNYEQTQTIDERMFVNSCHTNVLFLIENENQSKMSFLYIQIIHGEENLPHLYT